MFQSYKDNTYHIVYFDFNDFKPFNDSYGFRQGDRAILIFAELLKKHLEKDSFIAHIGGDDFFVSFKNQDLKEVSKKVNSLIKKFASSVQEFYSKRDKERGYIKIIDRFGIKRNFPLLSVAAAILEINSNSDISNFDTLIAKLKKDSKLESEAITCCL